MEKMPMSTTFRYHPSYVHLALELLPNLYSSKDADDFEERYGGFDVPTLLRALREGSPLDKYFALSTLGVRAYTEDPFLSEDVLPFLQSPFSIERWISALCLGQMNEPEAFPVLTTMLTEFFPPHKQYMSERFKGEVEWHYDHWRAYIPALFVQWNQYASIPQLRFALQEVLRVEQEGIRQIRDLALLPVGVIERNSMFIKRLWEEYVNTLVYALGCFKAMGVLTDLAYVDKARLAGLRVQLIMGFLDEQYHNITAHEWDNIPAIQTQVINLLEHTFGLSKEEQQYCVRCYEEEILPSPF